MRRLELGIFLASYAVLLAELLLTRVFSVTMFHHLSFLAVSLAMMGLGASGLAVTLWPARFPRERLPALCGGACVAFALTLVAGVALAFHLPVRLESSLESTRNALVVFAGSAVPFVAGGLVLALILARHSERAHRLYGLDLLGAAAACASFVPACDLLGAPSALLVAAALSCLAGVVLAGSAAPRWRGVNALGVLLFGVATLANLGWGFYDVRMAKGAAQPPTLVTRWNSFSRVEVLGTLEDLSRARPPLSWGYSHTIAGTRVREVHLRYDAGALTQITGFAGDLGEVAHLRRDVTAAAHHLRRQSSVLVIGAGGGRDLLTALVHGSRDVVGVEINPLTVELMRGRFAEFSGGLYTKQPGVTVFNADGRVYVRQSTRRFDLIQASLVDTWAASAAGAYSLAENSLYTLEAFRDFLAHLEPEGVLSLSRWYGSPPVEVLRVLKMAEEALRREGIAEPARHLVVVRTRSSRTKAPSLATVLVKRSPFRGDELASLRAWAEEMDFALSYVPGEERPGHTEPGLLQALGPEAEAFIATLPFDLSVVSDERPFFFDRVPLVAWLRHRLGFPAPAAGAGELPTGGQTLLAALIATTAFSLALLLLPLLARRGRSPAGGPSFLSRRGLGWALYFLGLGLGYIGVEIVVIQRLNLYLGNPSYALSVVLFTMLSASGLGSLVAERLAGWRPAWLLGSVCLGIAAYAAAMPGLSAATLNQGTAVRVGLAIVTLAPLAFVMGMPFPAGLRRCGTESADLAAWAWALNAGASVLGSVLAVLVAMSSGFSAALAAGAGAYLLALLGAALLRGKPPE